MIYDISFFFFMFYCYSVLGWIVECTYCSIINKRLVHNRGFLLGNYCPIYGCGAMYMYFFLSRYYNEPITLFVMAFVGTSIIEYLTSYIMEKIFKARWWDYSNMRFNLEGRVCLRNSVGFGLLGLSFTYFINPVFLFIFRKFPKLLLIIISIILFITFVVDLIISFSIMTKLKKNLTNIRKDSTDDIDKEVNKILAKNSFYLRKLFDAFPKVQFSIPLGEKIVLSIKKTLDNVDKLRKERKKRAKELKKELKRKRV